MPITKGCMELVEDASRKIQTLSLEEAMKKHGALVAERPRKPGR